MRTLLAALTALMLFAKPMVAASDPPVQSAEIVFWQSISSSTYADDFIAYLERYPQGVFAPLARNKLKRMSIVVMPPKAPKVSRMPKVIVEDPLTKFDGIWKWVLDLDGWCYGMITEPISVKNGKLLASYSSPLGLTMLFRGDISENGKASVRSEGAVTGKGTGTFTANEANGWLDATHPDGWCEGTWTAHRITKALNASPTE